MKLKNLLIIALLLLCSCSSIMNSALEKPVVTLSSFRALPGGDSIVPTFEIGLHVVNPNSITLPLKGLVYEIELEGHQILYGVTSDLPRIAAYSDADVTLTARPDLFSTVRLFSGFLNQPRDEFSFDFNATLDVGTLLPKIRVKKSGAISLSPQ